MPVAAAARWLRTAAVPNAKVNPVADASSIGAIRRTQPAWEPENRRCIEDSSPIDPAGSREQEVPTLSSRESPAASGRIAALGWLPVEQSAFCGRSIVMSQQ